MAKLKLISVKGNHRVLVITDQGEEQPLEGVKSATIGFRSCELAEVTLTVLSFESDIKDYRG